MILLECIWEISLGWTIVTRRWNSNFKKIEAGKDIMLIALSKLITAQQFSVEWQIEKKKFSERNNWYCNYMEDDPLTKRKTKKFRWWRKL